MGPYDTDYDRKRASAIEEQVRYLVITTGLTLALTPTPNPTPNP